MSSDKDHSHDRNLPHPYTRLASKTFARFDGLSYPLTWPVSKFLMRFLWHSIFSPVYNHRLLPDLLFLTRTRTSSGSVFTSCSRTNRSFSSSWSRILVYQLDRSTLPPVPGWFHLAFYGRSKPVPVTLFIDIVTAKDSFLQLEVSFTSSGFKAL